MNSGYERLKAEVLRARRYGVTTVELRPLSAAPSVPEVIDQFVESLGFHGIGRGWYETTREDAVAILHRILNRDLAYDAVIMHGNKAGRLARQFLACFEADARHFTNGTFHQPPERRSEEVTVGPGWNPITPATFDTGVVCLDDQRIGILWVQDED
jgi:hypothetical protein